MPVAITCPSCATHLGVPDYLSGNTIKCLNCGEPFLVPKTAPTVIAVSRPRSQPPRNEQTNGIRRGVG